MWETQTISLWAGRSMIFFEHDERKFEAYCEKRKISPLVQDWRSSRRSDNPATIYNIAWLANHFHPSNFEEHY